MNDVSIEEALRDLAVIRRIVEEHRPKSGPESGARRTFLLIQAGAFFSGLAFFIIEAVTGGTLTELLLLSRSDRAYLVGGLAFVAVLLTLLITALHLILRSGAARIGADYHRFLAENDRHFHNLSLSTDLLVKFVTFSLFVIAPRPEWIGGLLLIFTGDYLLQGRLFRLPFRTSIALGILCLGAGVLQLLLGAPSLLPTLAGYCLVSGLSFARALQSTRGERG